MNYRFRDINKTDDKLLASYTINNMKEVLSRVLPTSQLHVVYGVLDCVHEFVDEFLLWLLGSQEGHENVDQVQDKGLLPLWFPTHLKVIVTSDHLWSQNIWAVEVQYCLGYGLLKLNKSTTYNLMNWKWQNWWAPGVHKMEWLWQMFISRSKNPISRHGEQLCIDYYEMLQE